MENAVRLLVTRFIPLNPADLEEWMADPEGWVNVEEQDNEQWVFEIRVSLFLCRTHFLAHMKHPWICIWGYVLALRRACSYDPGTSLSAARHTSP